MPRVSDLMKLDCLVWETERPTRDITRRSSKFWLLGYEWYFVMGVRHDNKHYVITLLKATNLEPLTTYLNVTTYIRAKAGKTSCWETGYRKGAEQTVWYCPADTVESTLGKDLRESKWTAVFTFCSDQPLMLHLRRSETDKCVQAFLDIPPDLERLSYDFSQILEDETFPDVKLRCGDRSIHAHRSILSGRSKVFAAMFRNKMVESETGTVDITDVDSEVLDLLLKYVYSGKAPDLSDDTARKLYEAGDKYSIHCLKKVCSDWMIKSMTAKNCLNLLILADAHGDGDFKERVVDFAAENLESITKSAWAEFDWVHGNLAVRVYKRRLAPALSKQSLELEE